MNLPLANARGITGFDDAALFARYRLHPATLRSGNRVRELKRWSRNQPLLPRYTPR